MGKKKSREYVPPVGPGSKSVAPEPEGTLSVAEENVHRVRQQQRVAEHAGNLAASRREREYIPPVGPGSKSVAP